MTTLNLTLPNSIQRHLQEMAETYLRTRADHEAFRTILDKVPQRAPLPGDE